MKQNVLVAAGFAFLAAGCGSGISTSTDYDPSASFAGYSTYDWIDSEGSVDDITSGRAELGHVDLLEELALVVRDTTMCGLGQSAPNPVLSTLRWFREEYEAHLYRRKCPARMCAELVTFRIDPELCKGCTACVKKCPTEAIFGARLPTSVAAALPRA